MHQLAPGLQGLSLQLRLDRHQRQEPHRLLLHHQSSAGQEAALGATLTFVAEDAVLIGALGLGLCILSNAHQQVRPIAGAAGRQHATGGVVERLHRPLALQLPQGHRRMLQPGFERQVLLPRQLIDRALKAEPRLFPRLRVQIHLRQHTLTPAPGEQQAGPRPAAAPRPPAEATHTASRPSLRPPASRPGPAPQARVAGGV